MFDSTLCCGFVSALDCHNVPIEAKMQIVLVIFKKEIQPHVITSTCNLLPVTIQILVAHLKFQLLTNSAGCVTKELVKHKIN